MANIRTRFAPSPTGSMHIGGLRTALYSYALAKHSDGEFLLRIEDTDKKREVEGGKEQIQNTLKEFGLVWDGPVYVQSDLSKDGRYKNAAEKLVKEGHAFYCDCKAKNAKEEGFSETLRDPCRKKGLSAGAVKLKVPDGEKISFNDFVLGKEVSWDTSSVTDTTLFKTDGMPTYHLAVVVDDHEMEITHALRGHDWMPSTPIHLLIYKYLGFDLPEIGHLTDILDPEGGKLSKRKGSTSCEGLLKEGYLHEAILNFVLLLGWAPKDNRELFTLPEFVKAFDSKGFQKSNPVFNREKLNWFNQQYIQKLSSDKNQYISLVSNASVYRDYDNFSKVVPGTADYMPSRMTTLKDFDRLGGYIFRKSNDIEPLVNLTPNYKSHVSAALQALEKIDSQSWSLPTINQAFGAAIKKNNFKTGEFYMDLRGTISGSKFTPPLNETLVPIGLKETVERLEKGLKNSG